MTGIGNHYDPRTGKVGLQSDASLYACFHELAHKEQHEKLGLLFSVLCWSRRVRIVGWVINLWIEFDAYRRAKARLKRLECWNQASEKEARSGLLSYLGFGEIK
jgi:hypothetical protein